MIDKRNLGRVVASAAGVVVAAQAGTAWYALREQRRDYADAVWGPGLAAVAITSAVVGNGSGWRRWALAAVATGWAARLETLMLGRLRGSDEEDDRYIEFLDGDPAWKVVGKVFVTQGLAQLVVSAPVMVAAASPLPSGRRRWLFPAGIALMVGGALVEATADRQKAAFKDLDDDDKPDVLDTGLWAWSRHPNYLGDSLVWDGAYLAAATSTAGALTVPAPVAMTYFLMYATGAKRTEDRMSERRAYRNYQSRVAFFFPNPVKHA